MKNAEMEYIPSLCYNVKKFGWTIAGAEGRSTYKKAHSE